MWTNGNGPHLHDVPHHRSYTTPLNGLHLIVIKWKWGLHTKMWPATLEVGMKFIFHSTPHLLLLLPCDLSLLSLLFLAVTYQGASTTLFRFSPSRIVRVDTSRGPTLDGLEIRRTVGRAGFARARFEGITLI